MAARAHWFEDDATSPSGDGPQNEEAADAESSQ